MGCSTGTWACRSRAPVTSYPKGRTSRRARNQRGKARELRARSPSCFLHRVRRVLVAQIRGELVLGQLPGGHVAGQGLDLFRLLAVKPAVAAAGRAGVERLGLR